MQEWRWPERPLHKSKCAFQLPRRTKGKIALASAVNNDPGTSSFKGDVRLSSGATTQNVSRGNPVAHEVRVIATGARPGENAEKRELFMEETCTVLVFENGAVIRLQAAVAQGQLLFLTNQESKREVVAQVTRMRVFRPTNCYVELEFTERAPGFWGLEFPDAPALVPPNTQQSEAAELVHSAEVISDNAAGAPASPSVDAVEALKNEVEALREQLKLLQTQAAERPPVGMSLPSPAAEALAPSALPVDGPKEPDRTAAAIEPAAISKKKVEPIAEEAQFFEEELLPKPALDFSQAKTAAKQLSKPESKNTSSGSSNGLRVGLLVAALLLIAGGAWHENWIPGVGRPGGWPAPPSSRQVRAGSPALPAANPAINAAGAHSVSGNSVAANRDSTESPTAAGQESSGVAGGGNDTASSATTSAAPDSGNASAEKPAQKPGIRERLAAVMNLGKRSSSHANDNASPAPMMTSAVAPAEDLAIIPPKLIKSVRPNPPAEALRGYISGNVNIDAVVDTAGRVKSMKVVSGPATLRNAAMEALKEYRYQPATQKGKPVIAHVNVTVQFWYEP